MSRATIIVEAKTEEQHIVRCLASALGTTPEAREHGLPVLCRYLERRGPAGGVRGAPGVRLRLRHGTG